ncbi:hypothetical protein L6164_012158 [Bauhinia variegata]|uniref:Uncharacterized protein n=1 Tax=Bauhinia variegata TaxID=167791 RepID=A0ACB9P973_BAUVA|nr:hypothetical protein L6164_012158 [Bauhinia variegata]
MKIIFWNCWGLGNPLTVHHFKGICKSHSPDMAFVAKSKNDDKKVQAWLRKYGMTGVITVRPVGRAWGLALTWNETVDISNVVINSFLISCDVLMVESQQSFSLVGVYASTEASTRREQLGVLERSLPSRLNSIVIRGDFNVVLRAHEKERDSSIDKGSIKDFRDFMMATQLVDLGFTG